MLEIGPILFYHGILVYSFVFVCGLLLGSFLNSWIWRTRENIRVVGRAFSMCVHCRRTLKWYEKIPLFSCLLLRGKCRTCCRSIPLQYFWVELGSACLLTLVAYYYINSVMFSEWRFLRDIFFLTFLIIIFVYDILYGLILSRIVWPGALVGLAINVGFLGYDPMNLILGGIVGGGFFAVQYLVSRGRWIGGGDVRLGLMMGVWLGWQLVLLAIFLAYIIGAIWGVGMLIRKKGNIQTAVPFGAFLAVTTFFCLYHGQTVINWYLSLIK